MKFRLFTEVVSGRKIAVNVDHVLYIEEQRDGTTLIEIGNRNKMPPVLFEVTEPFDVVFSRLNTIAE